MLTPTDPHPVEFISSSEQSQIVLVCDHAGREIPSARRHQPLSTIDSIAERCSINFGCSTKLIAQSLENSSYAEAEQFCLNVARRAVLNHEVDNARAITQSQLKYRKHQPNSFYSNSSIYGKKTPATDLPSS